MIMNWRYAVDCMIYQKKIKYPKIKIDYQELPKILWYISSYAIVDESQQDEEVSIN